MGHVLKTLHAAFHGQPSPLQGMRAPDIPMLVRKLLPVNLTVVVDFQRVDPIKRVRKLNSERERVIHLWTKM